MSVYNPSIPNATDLISNSQAPFKTNFTQLNTQFGVDHVPFNNSGSNGTGFHKQVTLPTPLGGDPGGVVGGVIYTKLVSAVSQLFFENSASTVTQLTGLPRSVVNPGSYTFPGGLIIKWGTYTLAPGVPTTPVVFASAFPTNIFAITFGSDVSGSPNDLPKVAALTTAGFTGSRVNPGGPLGGTYTYYYIAIGN